MYMIYSGDREKREKRDKLLLELPKKGETERVAVGALGTIVVDS